MSLTNILTVVDLENIEPKPDKQNPGTESQPIEITNPDDCIFLFDDQSEDTYLNPGKAQLVTSTEPGDLLAWSLLKKERTDDDLYFVKIDPSETEIDGKIVPIFNWCDNGEAMEVPPPIIYFSGKKGVAAVSDKLTESAIFSYTITFKLIKKWDDTPYYYILDPFIETRKRDTIE
jgi:hypothetical protein